MFQTPVSQRILEALAQTTDLVLIDAPPVLHGPDTMALADAMDAVLLVINAKRTRKRSFQRARHQLVNVNILGEVLNDCAPMDSPYLRNARPTISRG